MKKILYLSLIPLLVYACSTSAPPKETKFGSYLYEHKAMPMDTVNSMVYKWANKPVLETKLLDNAESLKNWVLTFGKSENVGTIKLSDEKVFEGKSSIKFVCPTKIERDLGSDGRYWGRQNLTRTFNKEDFSEWNRISVNIYPDFKGFKKLYLTIILNNEGNVPDRYGKEGWHTVMLDNHKWNKLVMEIPHLPHDKVTGITISYGLQGNEPGAADTIVYYLDNLALEKVDADYYEGWGTDDAISFTHSGYNINEIKTAFTSVEDGETFKVVDNATGNVVLEKAVAKQDGRIGTFKVFDFTEVKTPGTYKLVYGSTESDPFPIDEDIWISIIEKISNQFYLQRCGFEQPGIHDKCHLDWYTVYNGDTIIMAGGWHDAGDLSQSYWQTASATASFFRLARLYEDNKRLSDRLIEEGKWGLEWLHKNQFDGLQVISWTTHDSYTDNVIGNYDDKFLKPGGRPSLSDNYHSIVADVEAYLTLKKSDPELASRSIKKANDYWNLLAESTARLNTDILTNAIIAGAKLYGATNNEDVLSRTSALSDSLIQFQQQEKMNWSIPLSGFFYSGRGTNRFFGNNHSYPAASPIIGLVELCKVAPKHENYDKWLNSVKLHAEYLKATAETTAPYYMFPANIYKMNNTEDTLQIKEGIKLDNDHYLRMFPVWQAFRGNSSVILSPGVGLAAASQLLDDAEARRIALAQVEWMLGKNPFSQSLMYGEGYRFSTQYAAFTGDITGGLPVGILTRDNLDIPYWKMAVLHNYKELWGQPAFRMMEVLYALYN